jgi:uncharacterized membrane protein YphA (DoxX/SURF4 family)
MIAVGGRVYGLCAVALGIPGLIYGNFPSIGLQVPVSLPGYQLLLYASAALLILAGLAVNLPRVAAAGCLALAAFFTVTVLALHLPNAAKQPAEWVSYEAIAENTVMAMGGVLAWTLVTGVDETRTANIARVARLVFGVCLVIFGISEFVYSKFTAAMVPAWMPPSQLVWTYITGAAHIAAGLAVVSGIQARLAAMLLTAMYVVFALIVHLPRVIADPSTAGVWSENGVNLVLTGAAWVLMDSLAKAKRLAG